MTTKAAEGASSYRSEKWMMKRGSAAQEQYSFYGKQHITRPHTNGLMALGTAGNKITLVYFSPLYCAQYNRTIQTDTFLCFPCSYIPSSLMRLHHLFSHWSSAFCAVRNDKKKIHKTVWKWEWKWFIFHRSGSHSMSACGELVAVMRVHSVVELKRAVSLSVFPNPFSQSRTYSPGESRFSEECLETAN